MRPTDGLSAQDALAAALRSVRSLSGGSQIEPIRVNPFQPVAGTYQGGPREMIGQHVTPGPGQGGGGGGGYGAGAKAAGLEKLGAGAASAIKQIMARNQAKQADAAANAAHTAPSTYGVSPQQSGSPPPGQPLGQPGPGAEPFGTPLGGGNFAPIGQSGGAPLFSQPGQGRTSPNPFIGPAGSSLPTWPSRTDAGGAPQNANLFHQLVSAYQGHGWSPTQAVNIASVQLKGEGAGLGSGGADAAQGGSNGLSQWSADRWSKGVDWMKSNGFDPRSVEGQTGWTTQELRNDYRHVNPSSISSLVNDYESPRKDLREGEIARSQNFATANYGQPSPQGQQPFSVAADAASPQAQPAQPAPQGQPNEPSLISPGQPQTSPAYSDDTWNNRPQFDYGGQQPAPAAPVAPGGPIGSPTLPGGGIGGQLEGPDQSNMLAQALAQQPTGPQTGMPTDMSPMTGPQAGMMSDMMQSGMTGPNDMLISALMQQPQNDFGGLFGGGLGGLFG